MEKLAYQSFTELVVWKKARGLKNDIQALVKMFPSDERFRLTDQLIRSSRAINSNIAEGHGRYSFKDQIHFCIQARGSLSETLNHLIDAFDCRYIDQEALKKFKTQIDEIQALLNGYITYLRNNISQNGNKSTDQPIN
jgi:four helix bundle protein